jgi:hypothetical protein
MIEVKSRKIKIEENAIAKGRGCEMLFYLEGSSLRPAQDESGLLYQVLQRFRYNSI